MRKNFFYGLFACVVAALMMSCAGGDGDTSKYLAVSLDDSEYWSIIDDDGDVVLKDAFERSGTSISEISGGGVFWVERDNKYVLHSVKSQKPVSDVEYDDVTVFNSGHACAIVKGEPIRVVDEKGAVVATLSEDIVKAERFYDGMAAVCKIDGSWGFINTDGDIAIDTKYSEVGSFSEGKAVVCRRDNPDYAEAIDKHGDVLFTISLKQYKLTGNEYEHSIGRFQEGRFLVWDRTDGCGVFLNKHGLAELKMGREYDVIENFNGGYFVAHYQEQYSFVTYEAFDKNGRKLFQTGKYDVIQNLGSGLFFVINLVSGEMKAKIVDADGKDRKELNRMVVSTDRIGDSFIAQDDESYLLMKPDGKIVSRFDRMSSSALSHSVEYKNYKAFARQVLAPFTDCNFLPLEGETKLGKIVNKLEMTTDDTDCKFLYLPSFKVGETKVGVQAFFDNYSYEYSTDKWYSNATLTSVGEYMKFSKYDEMDPDNLKQCIVEILTEKGFVLDSDNKTLNANIDGRKVRIRIYQTISRESWSEYENICIMLWPDLGNGKKSPFEDDWFFRS